MHSMIGKSRLFGAMMMGLLSAGVAAQGSTLGANDCARAEHFLIYNTMPLVDHAVQKVDWLDDSHFWYRDHDINGDHFVQMDVASGKTTPLFDQVKLAAALGKVTGNIGKQAQGATEKMVGTAQRKAGEAADKARK